jgi:hypothetical protein
MARRSLLLLLPRLRIGSVCLHSGADPEPVLLCSVRVSVADDGQRSPPASTQASNTVRAHRPASGRPRRFVSRRLRTAGRRHREQTG